MGKKKKKRKKPPNPYKGLGSVLPRGLGSRSIVTRTQTPMKGTTSGGAPSLGKRRK